MSPGGRAERMGFLREAVARIGAGSPAAGGRAGGGLCEVLPAGPGDAPAAAGFALGLALRRAGGAGGLLWISDEMSLKQSGGLYGAGLAAHMGGGSGAAGIILVRAADARQALWAIEEALRSPAPAAVIGEVWDAARHCDLTATRRFLLAARCGGGLGVLLHGAPAPCGLSTAARERYEVRAMPGVFRASAGGRQPIFGAPAFQARQLKGVPATAAASHEREPGGEREFCGAALSEPPHSRARA